MPVFPDNQWLSADFPDRLGVLAGTTTREFGDLNPRTADPQRSQALAAGFALDALPWLQQVHGTGVLELPGPGTRIADAAWTRAPATACVVLTADCLPVLFAADDGSVVAAAHAGWRGLCAGVLEQTVAALPVPASALWAWLGPAISAASFEVGPEVRDAFIATDPKATEAFVAGSGDRWFADLYQLARQRLIRLGIPQHRLSGGECCTVRESDRWFSYRRDAAASGRMASVIMRGAPGRNAVSGKP